MLPTRYVDRWKPTDDGGTIAKSRLVILGFKDPHVLQVERSAPTPTNEGFACTMQVIASNRWKARSSDIKNAFGQARKSNRTPPICGKQPPGGIPGYNLHPDQLLLARTEVYGLISGPSWLRQSLVADLEDLGYVRNKYDRCILSLPPHVPIGGKPHLSSGEGVHSNQVPKQSDTKRLLNQGSIMIEVDDILEAGEPRHDKLMQNFYAKYKYGKCKVIMDDPDGTRISGIGVRQNPKTFTFTYDMNQYA